MRAGIIASVGVFALALTVLTAASPSVQQPLERFSATAVGLANQGGSPATRVDMTVTRWTSDAEREQLLTTLVESGSAKLADVLHHMPEAGVIRTPDTMGYALRFARSTALEGGGERIVLITDRPIAYWETQGMTRSMDYPFTVVELRIGPNGKGEGKLSLATKIVPDSARNTVVLENYGEQPLALEAVQREKK